MSDRDEVLAVIAEGEAARVRDRIAADELRARNAAFAEKKMKAEYDAHKAKLSSVIDLCIRVSMYIFLMSCAAVFFVCEDLGTLDPFLAGICVGSCLMGTIMVAAWKGR